jgi:flagellar biosynthesis chaperone FliJ
MSGTIDTARWQWHQSWILRLEHERAVCAADVAARERDVARASVAAQKARQRVEQLERFRDKARRAWDHAVTAEEQKQIDVLATLRHVAALRESAQRSRT